MSRLISETIRLVFRHFRDKHQATLVVAWMIGNYFRHAEVLAESELAKALDEHREIIKDHLKAVIDYAVIHHNHRNSAVDIFRGAVMLQHLMSRKSGGED